MALYNYFEVLVESSQWQGYNAGIMFTFLVCSTFYRWKWMGFFFFLKMSEQDSRDAAFRLDIYFSVTEIDK